MAGNEEVLLPAAQRARIILVLYVYVHVYVPTSEYTYL